MNLIKQPNAWSCVACSFAMATKRTLEEYIDKIGHDGSEIWWADVAEPYGRRCFTVAECTNVAWNVGYYVHEYRNGYEYGHEPLRKFEPNEKELYSIMNRREGVLLATLKGSDNSHCLAWDGAEVLDPLGFKSVKECYNIESFLIIGER